MFRFLTLFGIALIESLISYFFFDKVFEKKRKPVIVFFVDAALYISGIAINLIFSSTLINTIYFAIINIVFSITCFKASKKIAIFYSLLLDVFSTSLEFAVILNVSALFDESVIEFQSDKFILLFEGLLSKLLYFICVMCLAKVSSPSFDGIRFPRTFYIFPASTIFTLICFWYICIREDLSEQTKYIFSGIILLLFLSTILILISYQNSEKRERKLYELETEMSRVNIEKNYYNVLKKQNENIIAYAHDAKNHLTAIKSLNKDPTIEKYINKLFDDLKSYTNVSHNGNEIFDVMINKYVTECNLRNINFKFDVRLSNLKILEDFDLVTIVGNLMDNAVESAEKSADKIITLETDYRNSYEILIIQNSCDISPASTGENLVTSKSNKRLHGIGVKSVRKTLKKYSGDLDWEYDEKQKMFSLTVMIYNPERT